MSSANIKLKTPRSKRKEKIPGRHETKTPTDPGPSPGETENRQVYLVLGGEGVGGISLVGVAVDTTTAVESLLS